MQDDQLRNEQCLIPIISILLWLSSYQLYASLNSSTILPDKGLEISGRGNNFSFVAIIIFVSDLKLPPSRLPRLGASSFSVAIFLPDLCCSDNPFVQWQQNNAVCHALIAKGMVEESNFAWRNSTEESHLHRLSNRCIWYTIPNQKC